MPVPDEPFSPPRLSDGPGNSSPLQPSEHETNDHSSAGSEVHDESSGDESLSDDGYDPLDFASDHSGSAFQPSDDEGEASVSEEESLVSDSESSAPSAEEDDDEESSEDDEDELRPSREQILVDTDDSSHANFAPAPRKKTEYLTLLSFNPDGSGPSGSLSGGALACAAVGPSISPSVFITPGVCTLITIDVKSSSD
ncbi:uncharacterized protein LOC62_06G008442 [Vanrija pseudolonga]|uniref:Uncharacterized protein n=1 Tax=Vanrija pseudolonga TaxID=143232 RepID=A0AAF0YDV1_9TREE|nr:hypothetical protein LOC62_06G008442 [Vanrija pseudolonga]